VHPQQLDQLAAFVRDHPVREPLSTQHSALSTSGRTQHSGNHPAHCERPRCTTRPRSGTPIAPGTIRLATPPQKGLIRRMFGEMRWTESTANNWLVRFYGTDTIDQIGTVQTAARSFSI